MKKDEIFDKIYIKKQKCYVFDFDKIKTIKDIKRILSALDIVLFEDYKKLDDVRDLINVKR